MTMRQANCFALSSGIGGFKVYLPRREPAGGQGLAFPIVMRINSLQTRSAHDRQAENR